MTDYELRYGSYRCEKQNDNSYTIYFCINGNKRDIIKDNVRGCNVNRSIAKLEQSLFNQWLEKM